MDFIDSILLSASAVNTSVFSRLYNNCQEIINVTENGSLLLQFIPYSSTSVLGPWIQTYNLFFDVFLVGLILVAGITGNVLSCLVLLRERSHSSTSLILIGLAVFDTLFLIDCLFFQFCKTLSISLLWVGYMNVYAYNSKFLYMFGMSVRTMRNWTVVMVTLERWIAVCLPLQAPRLCTCTKTRLTLLFIVVTSLLYNIPQMFVVHAAPFFCYGTNEYQIHGKEPFYVSLDDLPFGVLIYKSVIRPWAKENFLFKLLYRVIFYTIVIIVLPYVIITVFNVLLIRGITFANARRAHIMKSIDNANRRLEPCTFTTLVQSTSCSSQGNAENHTCCLRVVKSSRSRAGEINRICVGLIVIYLVCEMPAVSYQIIHLLANRAAIEVTRPVSNALVCLNSGVNFFIYVFLGRRFRSGLKNLFRTVLRKSVRDVYKNDNSRERVVVDTLGNHGSMDMQLLHLAPTSPTDMISFATSDVPLKGENSV